MKKDSTSLEFQKIVQEVWQSNIFWLLWFIYFYRKMISFEIGKKSKKVKTMYKNLEYAPNYHPNHEITKK